MSPTAATLGPLALFDEISTSLMTGLASTMVTELLSLVPSIVSEKMPAAFCTLIWKVAGVPVIASPALTKFGGAWTGDAQCRFDKWRLSLNVAQLADGSLLTSASTSQAAGSFNKIELKDNDVALHYDTWLTEVVYAGHLVGPNRIEGTVHVAGSDCKWTLTR